MYETTAGTLLRLVGKDLLLSSTIQTQCDGHFIEPMINGYFNAEWEIVCSVCQRLVMTIIDKHRLKEDRG
jgi:hypothetical protein